MNMKRAAIICGIAVIPLWYAYRSVGEHRAIRGDEIFADEATILRHELEETKQQAEKDLEAAKLENTPEAQKRIVAAKARQCLQFAEAVQAKYTAFVGEQSAWRKELTELKQSKAGAAIAGSEDYVRVFRSFDEGFTSDSNLESYAGKIKLSAQSCREDEQKQATEWAAGKDAYDHLVEVDKALDGDRKDLGEAQTNFRWLEHVATGEVLSALDIAAAKLRVHELSAIEKSREEKRIRDARDYN